MSYINKNCHYIVLLVCTPISLLFLTYLITISDMNVMREFHYSTVFFEMFNRLSKFDFSISPELIDYEAFRVNGITTTYFLPFPALIRGILSIVGVGKSAILSILLASTVYLISQGFLFIELLKNQKLIGKKYVFYTSVALACITLAPPIIPMMSYPNMFIEAIIWGYSVCTLTLVLSISILMNPSKRKLILFGFICGLGLFIRVPYSLTICILFLLTVFYVWKNDKNALNLKIIIYVSLGIFIFFLGLLGVYNFMKWGSPLVFYALDYYGYSPIELAEFKKNGAIHWSRIIAGFSYYFLPNYNNFIPQWPFLNISSSGILEGMGNPINYREPSYPIPLITPVYFTLAALGSLCAIKLIYRALKHSSISPIFVAASCALIPPLVILCLHARAIRYMGVFIPAIALFSIIGIIFILQKTVNLTPVQHPMRNSRYCIYLMTACFCTTLTLFLGALSTLKQDYYWGKNEIYYPTEPIEFNKKYLFNSTQIPQPGITIGNNFLQSGWSEPESNVIWSDSENAFMRIPTPYFANDIAIKLDLLALVNKNHPAQEFNVYANKQFIGKFRLTSWTNTIVISISQLRSSKSSILERVTRTYVKPSFADIQFEFLNLTTPNIIGLGNDNRKISIGLVSMEIQTSLDQDRFSKDQIKKGYFFK